MIIFSVPWSSTCFQAHMYMRRLDVEIELRQLMFGKRSSIKREQKDRKLWVDFLSAPPGNWAVPRVDLRYGFRSSVLLSRAFRLFRSERLAEKLTACTIAGLQKQFSIFLLMNLPPQGYIILRLEPRIYVWFWGSDLHCEYHNWCF